MWVIVPHKPSFCSQPQYGFGDDILLNLVRTAIDRDLAPVEIVRRQRARPFGADRWLVPAIAVVLGLLRHRIGADRLHPQPPARLLDFPTPLLHNPRTRAPL